MKIALCFFGLPRLIKECYPDINDYFIKNNNVDIYAHFWWDESHKGKINRLHFKEKNDNNENPIEIFNNLYKPKKILIEDTPNNIDITNFAIAGYNKDKIQDDDNYSKIMGSFLLYSFYCRFKSISKCLELIENKNEYDLIIIARPDLLLIKKGKLIIDIKKLNIRDNIYYSSTNQGGPKYAGEHANKIGDWLFLGNYINIKKYIDTINNELINKKNNENLKPIIFPKVLNFNQIKDFINNLDLNNTITPLHNSERLTYWSKIANVNLEIFNSSISVRLFNIIEWNNKDFNTKYYINPKIYSELYDDNIKQFKNNDILPFYTNKIKFI